MIKRKIISFTIIPKVTHSFFFLLHCVFLTFGTTFCFLKSFGHVFSDVLLKGITPFKSGHQAIAIKTSYEDTNENAGSAMRDDG
jgi:hypothetical protein